MDIPEVRALVRIQSRLDWLTLLIVELYKKELESMALGQDILDAVAAETTTIDSFIALVQGLVSNNTISPDIAVKIFNAINAEKDKVQTAIDANTPAAPPTP